MYSMLQLSLLNTTELFVQYANIAKSLNRIHEDFKSVVILREIHVYCEVCNFQGNQS